MPTSRLNCTVKPSGLGETQIEYRFLKRARSASEVTLDRIVFGLRQTKFHCNLAREPIKSALFFVQDSTGIPSRLLFLSSMKNFRMKHLLTIIILAFMSAANAQEKIYLYPPTEKVTIDGFEKDKEPPYIEYFKANPDSVNGSAILVCPGGGYTHLADQHEGIDVAKFYSQHGYDAFVLRYRINSWDQSGHRYPDQYRDVTTAMRTLKSRAKEWKIDADRIGIIGFSAGGHLASMCATMHLLADKKSKNSLEQWSSRPAFAILIYPVIDLAGAAAHTGSREMLLGKNPDRKLVDSLSTHRRVDEHTPPTFLVYSNDDTIVPPENGLLFYQSLRKHNIPVSLHIYDHGGHGYGMAPNDKILNSWPGFTIDWLKRLGYNVRTTGKKK
jgi:acetyl esterase/lipase